MTAQPHDVSDLYLAPVVLELDRRLDELGGLSRDEIEFRVELETGQEPRDRADRAALVLIALTHLMEAHNWTVTWAPRGLQVSHHDHHLVLGVPDSLRAYLDN